MVDGAAGTKQLAAINDSQKLTGKEKITIQADDAGAIEAVFNGKAIGVLGRSGEPLTVDFSAKDSEVVKSSSADQK